MGIASGIKRAIEKVGTAYTVIRDSGNISGEFLDYDVNRQVTKPFIREFFVEVTLPYDTPAVAGDVIQFDEDRRCFLVMNQSPERFKNALISYQSVFYKANVSGELQRFSGETGWSSQTYTRDSHWETEKSPAYGLLTENLFGTDLDRDEEFAQFSLQSSTLYLPHSYGAIVLDRYVPSSGEYFKIASVESRKFDNVDVCHLEEDTRQ